MPTHSARVVLRWSTSLALAGMAALVMAGCDAAPDGGGSEIGRQVTVVGNGEVQGVPDTLTTEAGIEFVAADVTSAMNQTSERQQAVIDALVDAGVKRKDISTTQVSLQPQYGSSDGGSANIIGYRAGNTIRVKVERDSASQVLAVIVRAGGDATRINGVSYSIDDDSELVRDARERAFNDAKDRAEQYAQLSGLRLGQVISISEVADGTPPTPVGGMPLPRAMAAAPPVEPGQQTVSFTVTAVWELN
ncbi:hypothetical protein AWC18_12245 [Mycolicibacter nonchromogenicus]|uniref:SIMPL domain-containing protein n=1 Tax=Mycolicibacter nonchromogenicus TaxID=1782 RepID=A0A1X1Z9X5_MYCNO|nr:SIMPL domain-containing protein [Mycolicibacter nonchromogenicus]ORW20164.1 hypothetical protein AWC18_12245 [Mycolicibacter nonchromogenicus]